MVNWDVVHCTAWVVSHMGDRHKKLITVGVHTAAGKVWKFECGSVAC